MSGTTASVPAFDFKTLGRTGFNYTQGSYSLGYDFTVTKNMDVTALGFYDDLGNGISGSHAVALYDLQSHALLASATITSANTLTDLFRYQTITPVQLFIGGRYSIQAVTGTDKYAVNVSASDETVASGITYLEPSSADLVAAGSNALFPTSTGGNIFGQPLPATFTGDFGPNFLVGGTPTLVTPYTTQTVPDTIANGTIYNDNLTYQVASPPPSATVGANGLYHYSFTLTYQGHPTLVIPLHNAGDVTNLSAGTIAPYTSVSNNLQQDFGTSYTAAISVTLPNVAATSTYPIQFDSIYPPTLVTIALVGSDGVIHLVDPPIPNSTSASPVIFTAPSDVPGVVGTTVGVAGVSVADTAAVSGTTLTVTVTDTLGTLSAGTQGTQVQPAGGGRTLTLIGTFAQVNADLAALAYAATANGADTIALSATDSLGNTTTSSVVLHALAFGSASVSAAAAPALAGLSIASTAFVDAGGAATLGSGQTAAVVDSAGSTYIAGNASAGELIADGAGPLTFLAGAGSGTVLAGAAANLIYLAGGGNWSVALGNGADTVVAASGNDTLAPGMGGTLLFLGSGADSIASSGADTIIGAGGTATVNATGPLLYFGGSEAAVINLGGTTATLAGGGAETVNAQAANALVFGGTGALIFNAGSGASTVVSGTGGGTITGGSTALLYFGVGPSTYLPGSAVDTVIGSNGALTATGGAKGTLFFSGTAGQSQISTGAGASTIVGLGANDSLTATGSGNDVIAAYGAAAIVSGAGSSGNNSYFGFGSGEVLVGGSGQTALESASGNNTLVGGSGTTLFEILSADANRTISIGNFNPAQDFVQLQGYATGTAAAALKVATISGGSEILTLTDGTKVTFQGVTGLTSNSFI